VKFDILQVLLPYYSWVQALSKAVFIYFIVCL